MDGVASLRLQACQSLDVTDGFTVPLATLTPSQYAHHICMHPSKPLLAVAAGTTLAVYDLITSTRLSRLDMRGTICEMSFSPDGVTLVMVMQEWMIFGWSLATARAHVLVPRREKADKPLEACLLTVGGGPRAALFYCKYGKEAVRRATLTPGDVLDAKGRLARTKEGTWGAKMKLEPAKPIVGLALPPHGGFLMVLHVDGAMRLYNTTGDVKEVFMPLVQVQGQDTVSKGLPPPGTLLVVPHPSSPSTTLIIQAARFGGVVNVLQLQAGATSPTLLARARIPGGGVVLGAGILQDCQQVVAVVSSQPEGGRLRTMAWSMPGLNTDAANPDAASMQLVKVEPVELNPFLDPRASQQQLLQPSALAPPPPVNATFSPTPYANSANRYDAILGVNTPTQGAAKQTSDGGAAVMGMLHSMWAPTSAWAASVSHAGTLAGGLAPVVSQVLIHSTLPVIAVQLQPSAYMKNTPAYMQLTLSGAAPDEYAQIRKLLSVPLIAASSWDSLLSAGADRAMVAQQHGSLQHWTPTTFTGPIQLEAATTLASPTTPTKSTTVTSPAASTTMQSKFRSAGTPHLTLPGVLYYVSDSALCKYSLVSKAQTTMISLPEGSVGNGAQRAVHSMAYSRAGAWLVFFETRGVAANHNDRWQWTVIHATDLTSPVWLKPGKFGAFIGPREEQFAVVDASGRLAAVFSLATCQQAGAAPDYLYSLEGLSANGVALPVFPGPPRDPVPDPAASAVIGCVMWQSTAGGLAARPLPALLDPETNKQGNGPSGVSGPGGPNPGYSTLGLTFSGDQDDSSSNGEYDTPRASDGAADELGGEAPAEPLGTGAVAPGSSLGPLGPKYWLPLQAGELVMQVSWQALTWEPSGADDAVTASTGAEGTGGKSRVKPGPAMAAVMTNQRILLVTELLHVHASVSLHEHMCGVLPSPASSILWAGPALMILLVDGRILQLTWGGTVHAVCSISGEKRAHLAGATPDALLLLRPIDSKKLGVASWEVVHRPLSMLQPLVLGWSTLGLLSSTSAGTSAVAACRAVLRSLMEHSDPAPTTTGLIWALLGTCALDLGYALVSQNDTVEPRAYLAAAAAAGDWDAVERALALELERAAHHPAPPPTGSAGHCKLMAAAAGAVAHGQMKRAVNLLQMAGEWRLAMVIACASGDTSAVHSVAAKMSTAPTSQAQHEESESAQRMASALRNLYNSSVTAVPDAKLQLVGPDGDACLPEPGAWLLGAPRQTITARAEVVDVQSLREERGATIAPTSHDQLLMATLALDTGTRVALNLRAASVSQDGTAPSARTSNAGGTLSGGGALVTTPSTASTVAGTTPAKDTLGPLTDDFGLPINTAPPPMPLVSGGGSALDDIFGLDLMVSRTHTAKDEFASMATRSDGSNSDSDLSVSPSPAQQWKGKVTIRDKASAPTLASNPDQLRDAMKSLRLGAPGAPPLTSGNPMIRFTDSFNTSSPSFRGAGAGQFQGLSPALAAGMQHPPPQPLQPGSSFSDLPPPLIPGISQLQQQQQPPAYPGLSPALTGGMQQQQQPAGSFQGLPPALASGMQPPPAGSFQGLSPALAAGMASASQPANPFDQAPPAPSQAPWPSQQATTGTFQGLSPALASGMNQPAQPQQPAAGSFQGLSPALAAGMQQQQQQQQQPATGSFQGLSPALAAGMAPSPPLPQPAAQTAAFQGLSPALAAGMSQQQQPAAPAAAFKGLSPALAAGMTPQPQPQPAAAAGSFQGLSPALAAGMTRSTQQPAQAPAASFRGLSPALAAGMAQPAQQPPATNTFQGLSPALAAGMAQQPAKPAQAAAPAASTFAGLSPALAAGMTQTNQQAAAAPSASFRGLSPALAAGMVQPGQQPGASSFQGLSPALAAGMVGTATRPPPAAPQPAAAPLGNPDTLYHEGVMQLEQGAWAAADERFSQALAAISQLPQDETTRSKAAYCSQYLCAVQLLNVAASGNGPNEARLYRYAAALDLDPRHRTALTKESVARNKQQRNFKYCGDALTWLVTSLLSGPVSDSVLQPLQEAIDACEKAGNRDAAVPKGEDLEAFARASAGCRTREDVLRLLAPVLSAK